MRGVHVEHIVCGSVDMCERDWMCLALCGLCRRRLELCAHVLQGAKSICMRGSGWMDVMCECIRVCGYRVD